MNSNKRRVAGELGEIRGRAEGDDKIDNLLNCKQIHFTQFMYKFISRFCNFPMSRFGWLLWGSEGVAPRGRGGRLHLRLSTETLTSVDPVAVQVGSPQSAHVAQLRLCVNKVKITQVCVSKTQSELAASQEEGVHKPPQ